MAKTEVQAVKLRWDDNTGLPTVYANQAIVSHAGGHEFYLIFGEALVPAVVLQGESIEEVHVRPVAKIALTPQTMMRVADAVQQNVARFKETAQALTKAEEAADAE